MISYYIIEISQFDLALLEISTTYINHLFLSRCIMMVLLKFVVGMQIIQALLDSGFEAALRSELGTHPPRRLRCYA